jgi:glycosyltransferase involved in cell wall biosynthesis
LKIAAKIDNLDRDYFDETIRPLLDVSGAEYIGEITDREKSTFLSGALALLTPLDWPEPFGLVMIEAMACGTPVIAFNRGAVPEVVEDGVTGLVVENNEGAIRAVANIGELSRAAIRKRFEERFTARRMATDYLDAYQDVAELGSRLASQREALADGFVWEPSVRSMLGRVSRSSSQTAAMPEAAMDASV